MKPRPGFTRRDFMSGVALGTGGAMVSPLEAMAYMGKLSPNALADQPYPPSLVGLRGDHIGSFEVAHALVLEGESWDRPLHQTDETWDLVVVGGGVSGLAAAKLFRDRAGQSVRILILDNHDDFGGHAKRNEFEVDGQTLIGHGGSQTIEGPSSYSPVSARLLKDISIDVERFYEYFDRGFSKRYGLENGIFFTSEAFGVDRLTPDPFRNSYFAKSERPPEEIISAFPLSVEAKAALLRMVTEKKDHLPGLSHDEKTRTLMKISYFDFLKSHVGLPDEAAKVLREKFKGYWGLSWENLSALEGFRLGMPAMQNLGLDWDKIDPDGSDEPYIFHFPDGNAGVARLIVRDLIPAALPGKTMEDSVLTRVNYARLDEEGSPVRIRLNTTVVDVQHSADSDGVDVTCIQDGRASRVRGKHVILACNNRIIPHLCREVPKAQTDAINWATRAPLAYATVVLRNWRAFADLGYEQFYIPKGALTYSYTLDFPVSMGGYNYSPNPDSPVVLHGTCIPNTPGEGLSAREQFVSGRTKLYQLSFDDFEKDTFRHLDGALKKGGLDVERDVAGLTINRWPHGYAYEYNELYDRPEWNVENGPHVVGRAQMGRISIANSDASAYAYIDGAIDAADRAVNEQLA